jgi:hypothetical protein
LGLVILSVLVRGDVRNRAWISRFCTARVKSAADACPRSVGICSASYVPRASRAMRRRLQFSRCRSGIEDPLRPSQMGSPLAPLITGDTSAPAARTRPCSRRRHCAGRRHSR